MKPHRVRRWPRSRKRHVGFALLLGLLGLAAWINLPLVSTLFDQGADTVAALPAAPPFTPGQRVLVLAPHPDDETLCCGGLIQRAQTQGAQVFVVWVTSGDGFEFAAALSRRGLDPTPAAMRALGEMRVLEARRASARLGVPADRTFMLGFPDGGVGWLLAHPAQRSTAPNTGASAVYVQGSLTPGAPFSGQALAGELDRVRPDLLLAPAPQDFHADHHAVSELAQRLMRARAQSARLRFWVVHGGLEWPIPKGLHTDLALTVPPLAARLPWHRADLTAAEARGKLAAVDAYATQTRIMGRFMRAFVRRNELLSPQSAPVSRPPEP